ncbi:MAG: DUF4433 domain-containing protein [Proteobacteria bacterium]|nr:DUF4433 domain-containing protein [Pseudomonadota bacterium]
MRTEGIQRIVAERGIRFLLHFTFLRNVPAMVEHGIWPVADLAEARFDALVPPSEQLNKKPTAVSLSIEAMSASLFDKKSGGVADAARVALFLDPEILWREPCRFCATNAATRQMRDHRGYLGGPWGLGRFFDDPPEGLALWLPSDPDAEVQVQGRIAPDYILGAWTSAREEAAALQALLDRLPGPERDVLLAPFARQGGRIIPPLPRG